MSAVHGLPKIVDNILWVLIVHFLRRGFITFPQFFKRSITPKKESLNRKFNRPPRHFLIVLSHQTAINMDIFSQIP